MGKQLLLIFSEIINALVLIQIRNHVLSLTRKLIAA